MPRDEVGNTVGWMPCESSSPRPRNTGRSRCARCSAGTSTTRSRLAHPTRRARIRAAAIASRAVNVADGTWSEGLEPAAQEAELVAFWVGQNVPALGASLAYVGGPGAESEQPLQFGVLAAVDGVDVDVQSELPGPRIAARAEDEGWLRAAEAGAGRPDLNAAVVLPAKLDVAKDLAPERGEQAGFGAVDD
jgi:hypothetical protein